MDFGTGFVESNDIFNDARELRQRADRDGYLFFKGIVNKEAALSARRDIATVLQEEGWIDEGTDPLHAITHHEACLLYTSDAADE